MRFKSIKRVAKRITGLFKHTTLNGDASVHPLAWVSGPGRVILDSDAGIASGARILLRGGELRIGARSVVTAGAIVRVGTAVTVGEDCALMHYCVVYGEGGVEIGNRVLVGNHVLITSLSHLHEGRRPVGQQGMALAPVHIRDDVWIGAYSLIESGVTVGEGAIIGAHSYVRDDVPAFAVVGGVPARLLYMRETTE